MVDRVVRKDYFLDHDFSAYVDQWDQKRVITPELGIPPLTNLNLPAKRECRGTPPGGTPQSYEPQAFPDPYPSTK
jgi:hypothetical protein